MRNLIVLHRQYLRTKINLIVIVILMMVVSLGLLISINPFDLLSIHDLNRQNYAMSYQINMELLMKLTMVLISCYLYGSSFCHHQESYRVLILSNHHERSSRITYFLTKTYAIGSFIMVIILGGMISYCLIGYFFSTWFIINIYLIKFFFILILCALIYGVMAGILALITNNWFSSLIPYLIFLVSDFVHQYSTKSLFSKIFSFFFPTIINTNGEIYLAFGTLQAIMLLGSLLIIGTIIFLIKDLS